MMGGGHRQSLGGGPPEAGRLGWIAGVLSWDVFWGIVWGSLASGCLAGVPSKDAITDKAAFPILSANVPGILRVLQQQGVPWPGCF